MIRRLLAVLAPLAAVLAFSIGNASAATIPQPSWHPAGSWHMIFDDEFNGTSLNLTHWWSGWFSNNGPGPASSYEQAAYSPAHLSVSNGTLNMTLTHTPSSGQFGPEAYTGAVVMTEGKFQYSHGCEEVRAYIPPYNGNEVANWPAIWSLAQNDLPGEIDIFEGLGGLAEAHWHAYGGSWGTNPQPNMSGWHTFGVRWGVNLGVGYVTFYYDGKAIGTDNHGVTSNPQSLVITQTTTNAFGPDIVAPATMRIDWVRVWQR